MPKTKKKALKDKAWKLFSEYIRLKYMRGDGVIICYTCGKEMTFREAQAGHAIGGRTNSVLFDEEIVRPQCRRCNILLGGNYPVFITKLIEENGLTWWENKLKQAHETKKIGIKGLRLLIASLEKKIKKLKGE